MIVTPFLSKHLDEGFDFLLRFTLPRTFEGMGHPNLSPVNVQHPSSSFVV